MTNTTTAAAVAARLLALVPDTNSQPAKAALDALAAITDDTEHSEVAGVLEQAGEASTEYTTDGCWDDEIDVLVDEFQSE